MEMEKRGEGTTIDDAAAQQHQRQQAGGQESEQEFAQALASGAHDAGVGIRVRVLGTLGSQVHQAVASRPEVALLDDVVTASGRVELRYWVKEQAVSMTLHRFGNPSPRFHELAAQLLAPAHLGG